MTDLTGTQQTAADVCTAADALASLIDAAPDVTVYSVSIDHRGATGTSIRIAVNGGDDDVRQTGVDKLGELIGAEPRFTPAPTSSGAAYRVSGRWQGVAVDIQATLHNVLTTFERGTA